LGLVKPYETPGSQISHFPVVWREKGMGEEGELFSGRDLQERLFDPVDHELDGDDRQEQAH